jgi:phosphate:Na+ symporter
MKEGFETFQSQINLTDFSMTGPLGVIVFTLVGILATIIMQSSHATLVLVITALSVQQVTYDNALALVIGANVGTTITAVIGSLTSNTDGRRLALSDVLFKVTAGIVFMILINPITGLVEGIGSFIGLAPDDFTLKLAVFHTLFNIAGVIIMVPLVNKLVALVSFILPQRKIATAEPMYLNEAALELSDTVLEAVRKEAIHLYENAFAIIAHGLSLHRHDILSDKDLESTDVIKGKVIEINIDDEYSKTVKGLYNEIITYISRVQTVMTPEENDTLFTMRAACRDIVEAIKDTKHLNKNMSKYIKSDNPYIRAEYDKYRVFLGSVLRQISALKDEGGDPLSILALDTIKLEMETMDATYNGMLDELIREGKITAQMATSLMNDSAYVYDVTKKLVQMADALFATGGHSMKEAEHALNLDASDIDEIMDAAGSRV